MIFYPDGITVLCLTADYFEKLFLTESLCDNYVDIYREKGNSLPDAYSSLLTYPA